MWRGAVARRSIARFTQRDQKPVSEMRPEKEARAQSWCRIYGKSNGNSSDSINEEMDLVL